MKTILLSAIAISAFVVTAQAQRTPGNSKHPYGLTQASRQQPAPARQAVSEQNSRVVQRNYKNPQAEADRNAAQTEGTLSIILPARPVETVTNPLMAQDNYKRQNTRRPAPASAQPEERIIAKEGDVQKQ